jgi:hypothetical protein
MKKVFAPFNLYLLLAVLIAGCATTEKSKQNKEQSTVRLHLEAPVTDNNSGSGTVLVTKQKIPINVDREPFLSEGDLHHAEIVATPGGFGIALNFADHGMFQLDMVSTSNKGRRIAVLMQFPDSHWVAAPMITRRISDGVLTFTPDLTLEEAQRAVRGLNNVARKARSAF